MQVVPRPVARVAPVARDVIRLADGEAHAVRVRFVENAFAGTLFVVQGELSRGSADPALGLRVQFVDAAGARLGSAAWARSVPELQELRERAPESLRTERASRPSPAPREGAFAAIFETVPAGAMGVDLA